MFLLVYNILCFYLVSHVFDSTGSEEKVMYVKMLDKNIIFHLVINSYMLYS